MRSLAMRKRNLFALALGAAVASACAPKAPEPEPVAAPAIADASPSPERGRYLVTIAGCNDCHTAGFPESGGQLAEAEWLRGTPLGYRGPWGTTYPTNLRLHTAALSEDQWVGAAKVSAARPPMPVWALHAMTDDDLRSIYRFIRSLPGAAGDAAPAALPPTETPQGLYLQWPAPPPEAKPAS